MSSRCRNSGRLLLALVLVLTACNRERREYEAAPVQAPPPHPRLVTLQPGASAELVESWELFGNVPPVRTEADVDRVILPLIGAK